jgi:hypothetical protein
MMKEPEIFDMKMYVSARSGMLLWRDDSDPACSLYEIIGFDPSDGLYMLLPVILWGEEDGPDI